MLRSLAFKRPFFVSRNGLNIQYNRPMSNSSRSYLLTPAQVKALPKTSTAILDATWFMPNSPRSAREEYKKTHIPGAQYLDLDEVASSNELGLKHMMPSGEQFAHACGNLVFFLCP
jgi:3-mercaptopyruvate sulfurtransferase SseA